MRVPPEDKDPIVLHAPTRKSVACFGAVNLRTGQFVRTICKVFNAVTFQRFLAQLLRHRRQGRRIILVLDNARYHHAVILAPFLRQHAAHLKLLFLPPYSPQLAPIERVWKLTRRLAMHNRYFPTLGEVLNAVNACFNRWRRPNATLRRLCCIIYDGVLNSFLVVPANIDQGSPDVTWKPNIHPGKAIDPSLLEFSNRVVRDTIEDGFEQCKLIVGSHRLCCLGRDRFLVQVVVDALDGVVHVVSELFGHLNIVLAPYVSQVAARESVEVVRRKLVKHLEVLMEVRGDVKPIKRSVPPE